MPVLNNVVQGEAVLAEALHDADELILGLVALLAHEEAKRGLGEHGRGAGEVAVAGDDAVHGLAGDEVVIDAGGRAFGPEGGAGGVVLEGALGGGVPEDAVAVGREEEGDDDSHVGLHQQDLLAAVVHVAVVVLAEAIQGLVVRETEGLLHLIGGGVGDGEFADVAGTGGGLAGDDGAVGAEEDERAGLLVHAHDEGGGGDVEVVGGFLDAHAGVAGGFDDDEAGVRGVRAAEVGVDAHDVGAVEEDVFDRLADADLHAVIKAGEGEGVGPGGGERGGESELAGGVEAGGSGGSTAGDEGQAQREAQGREAAEFHGMRKRRNGDDGKRPPAMRPAGEYGRAQSFTCWASPR